MNQLDESKNIINWLILNLLSVVIIFLSTVYEDITHLTSMAYKYKYLLLVLYHLETRLFVTIDTRALQLPLFWRQKTRQMWIDVNILTLNLQVRIIYFCYRLTVFAVACVYYANWLLSNHLSSIPQIFYFLSALTLLTI